MRVRKLTWRSHAHGRNLVRRGTVRFVPVLGGGGFGPGFLSVLRAPRRTVEPSPVRPGFA